MQFLFSSQTIDIVLARAIDVSWVKTIGLSARAHRINIGGSSAKYEFILFGVNPSRTDGQEFVTASLITSAVINTSTTAGSLITWSTGAVYSDPAHPFAKLILRATGPTISTPGNLYAELSASLSLRGP
jgi:hypothetical protein